MNFHVLPFLLLFALSSAHAASFVVAGGLNASQDLQAAIDQCPDSGGCTIELPDSSYLLGNQVWIVGKRDVHMIGTGSRPPILYWKRGLLTTDSSGTAQLFNLQPPTGGHRPALPSGWLRWPLYDSAKVGGSRDTTNPYSTTGYQRNGMILVENSTRIRLERLVLDGREPAILVSAGALSGGRYDLIHGSVGVALVRSLATDVVGCELRNLWAGIYLNDANPACFPDTLRARAPLPFTACGTYGGHLIERNRIHGDWWAIFSEAAQDQGSVIRENLAWDLRNRSLLAVDSTVLPTKFHNENDDGALEGGFLLVKDAIFGIHVVSHNTLAAIPLPYAEDGFRPGGTALWSDNLISFIDTLGSTTQIYAAWHHVYVHAYGLIPNLWNTTLLHRGVLVGYREEHVNVIDSSIRWMGPGYIPRDTLLTVKGTDTVRTIHYDTVIVQHNCAKACSLPLKTPDIYRQDWVGLPWKFKAGHGAWWQDTVIAPDSALYVARSWWPDRVDSAGLAYPVPADKNCEHEIRICANCHYHSLSPDSAGFLLPAWHDTAAGRGTWGGPRGAEGEDGQLGSHVPLRLRARGFPRYDSTAGRLLLPIAMQSEGTLPEQLAVRRISVVGRSVNRNGYGATAHTLPTTDLGALDLRDTILSLPFTPGTDSFYQIDLWLQGTAGNDTLAATPVSWTWAPKASGKQYAVAVGTHVARASRTLRLLHRDGHEVLFLSGTAPLSRLLLYDISGHVLSLNLRPCSGGAEAVLPSQAFGVYFAALPEGSRRILIPSR